MPLKKKLLKDCRLYVVIDQTTASGSDLAGIAKKAVSGGADIVQFRPAHFASPKDILKGAFKIKKAVKGNGCLFIINNSADIAFLVDADGVHLGQEDLPLEAARKILPSDKIIGVSTHSLSQAVNAQSKGADYISIGPVFKTPTKKEYRPVGLGLIEDASRIIKIPFFAIGGIGLENIDRVILKGARRVAVVRAVVSARDIKAAARQFKDTLSNGSF